MSIILETILAVLLVATFYYCWRLSQKIRALQAGGVDFKQSISDFNMAVARAENTLKEIKDIALDTDKNIKEAKKRASALAADLSVLVDKGERIANYLENAISNSPRVPQTSPRAEIIDEPAPIKSETQARAASLSKDLNANANIPPARKQALQHVLSQIAEQRNEKDIFKRPGAIRVKENA